jgi:hypothetical protein
MYLKSASARGVGRLTVGGASFVEGAWFDGRWIFRLGSEKASLPWKRDRMPASSLPGYELSNIRRQQMGIDKNHRVPDAADCWRNLL